MLASAQGVLVAILRSVLGLSILILICFALSSHRKKIYWRETFYALGLQILFAFLVLKVPGVVGIFDFISSFFVKVLDYTKEGSQFLFGNIVNTETMGFIFAFQVLPTIVFFSALTTVLYYFGVLQKIVYGCAWVMSKGIKLSGAESLSTAGNIFLGQTEAPLLIKPYLPGMSRSELLCIMVGGMANIAGGVLAAYVGFLGGEDPVQRQMFATHLLCASIMSAPATILVSKLLEPALDRDKIDTKLSKVEVQSGYNALDALCVGTTEGVGLAMNVGAMLLVFTAVMAMANSMIQGVGHLMIGPETAWSLQGALSFLFSPIAWVIGIDGADLPKVGQLLGEKTILNEFYAYGTLAKFKASHAFVNERSLIIATYALCGFANFASIGIQVGGISQMAPNQRQALSKLGLKALVGGTICTLMTATIVGAFF
jgi:CNT family concentrative nucleoside transporter